jgi:hypothetical protein
MLMVIYYFVTSTTGRSFTEILLTVLTADARHTCPRPMTNADANPPANTTSFQIINLLYIRQIKHWFHLLLKTPDLSPLCSYNLLHIIPSVYCERLHSLSTTNAQFSLVYFALPGSYTFWLFTTFREFTTEQLKTHSNKMLLPWVLSYLVVSCLRTANIQNM